MTNDNIQEDNSYDRFCAICGEILPHPNISATFEITSHDWTSKRSDYFVCDICGVCYERMMKNINGGIEYAYKKLGREYLERD